jgi:hypothetical protein
VIEQLDDGRTPGCSAGVPGPSPGTGPAGPGSAASESVETPSRKFRSRPTVTVEWSCRDGADPSRRPPPPPRHCQHRPGRSGLEAEWLGLVTPPPRLGPAKLRRRRGRRLVTVTDRAVADSEVQLLLSSSCQLSRHDGAPSREGASGQSAPPRPRRRARAPPWQSVMMLVTNISTVANLVISPR